MPFREEYLQKIRQLQTLYHSKGKRNLLITNQNNISWLLRGRTFVNSAAVKSLVEVVVNDDGLFVISNNIEAKRLMEEEFSFEVSLKTYNWFEPNERLKIISALTNKSVITDIDCENELRNWRTVLTASEQETYISLGLDCAEAMQKACFSVKQGMSERKISGILAANCLERGIEPIVNLVAGDERIFQYRHPLPTAKILTDYLMMSLCGRRFGQIVSLTRFVSFSPLSTEIIRKRDSVHNLEALLLAETRPGAQAGDIFSKLVSEYEAESYPDEWKLHHQGGLTGYDAREIKVSFDSELMVQVGQVFAWNPSITGFKGEDSFLIGEKENIVLTETREFPYRSFIFREKQVEKPDILIIR